MIFLNSSSINVYLLVWWGAVLLAIDLKDWCEYLSLFCINILSKLSLTNLYVNDVSKNNKKKVKLCMLEKWILFLSFVDFCISLRYWIGFFFDGLLLLGPPFRAFLNNIHFTIDYILWVVLETGTDTTSPTIIGIEGIWVLATLENNLYLSKN